MAITNDNGHRISYDCDSLIRELESDIQEFGKDFLVDAVTKDIEGVKVYTDYNFSEDNKMPFDDLDSTESVEIIKASDLLEIFKQQNKIL